MESTPNLVDDRVKSGRGNPGQATLPLPLVSGPPRRLETRHPVDRRAAARGLPREDAERRVARREDAMALEHRVVRLRFALRERVRGAVRPRLEDDDPMARFREFRGDHGTARAGADDAHVGLEARFTRGPQGFDRNVRRLASRLRGTPMRRGVPDGRPVGVDAALEGLRVREEQDEPLHGLEALSLDPEPTVGPCQEKSLPFRLGPRRESLRTSGEEEVRPRVLERPKEPPEGGPLIRGGEGVVDAGAIVIDGARTAT